MIVIGIDPGISGALAFVRAEDRAAKVFDMPLLRKKSGRSEVDGAQLAALFRKFTVFGAEKALAVVEEVGAMTYVDRFGQRRGQGASSSFAFGKSFGVILGTLHSHQVKVILIKPAVWKSLLNLNSDKNISRVRAREKFPRLASELERVKDDGRAEALLLASIGLERFVG